MVIQSVAFHGPFFGSGGAVEVRLCEAMHFSMICFSFSCIFGLEMDQMDLNLVLRKGTPLKIAQFLRTSFLFLQDIRYFMAMSEVSDIQPKYGIPMFTVSRALLFWNGFYLLRSECYDRPLKLWMFWNCYWSSSQSNVFTRGWN